MYVWRLLPQCISPLFCIPLYHSTSPASPLPLLNFILLINLSFSILNPYIFFLVVFPSLYVLLHLLFPLPNSRLPSKNSFHPLTRAISPFTCPTPSSSSFTTSLPFPLLSLLPSLTAFHHVAILSPSPSCPSLFVPHGLLSLTS